MPAKGFISPNRAKFTPNPRTLLDYVNNVLYEHPELTMRDIAEQIGVPVNAFSCWRRGQPIPIGRAMDIARLVGDDVRKVRAIGLRQRHPELFKDESDDFSLLTDAEQEFLKIMRNSPLNGQKLSAEQAEQMAAFFEQCADTPQTSGRKQKDGFQRKNEQGAFILHSESDDVA